MLEVIKRDGTKVPFDRKKNCGSYRKGNEQQ